jgi:hypothetical protein
MDGYAIKQQSVNFRRFKRKSYTNYGTKTHRILGIICFVVVFNILTFITSDSTHK